MINWQATASHVIGEVHRNLPADADLATRKKALRAARPWEFASTSWGKKVWAKHSRKYLEKYGMPPLKAKTVEDHLSPLERLMEKSKGATVAFGLEAQGHIPTIETAISEGADWQEIGRRINWDGETARAYYERYLARKGGAA